MEQSSTSSPEQQNWFCRVAYDGTNFAGYQVQPGTRTVQGVLTDVLRKLYKGHEPQVHGCSRTDAGVHALDLCVNFNVTADLPIPAHGIDKALRGMLPNDIRIREIREIPLDFHVRHNNFGKAYTYLIHRGAHASPFLTNYTWSFYGKLDLDAMGAAAEHIIGEHDFLAFTAELRRQKVTSTTREVYSIHFREYGDILAITIIGKSFLYKMVRRIVSMLCTVGRGRLRADQVPLYLDPEADIDRPFQLTTSPPHGLFLERVFFSEEEIDYRPTRLPFIQIANLGMEDD